MFDAPFGQFLAHNPGQRAHGSFGNIGNLESGCIQLVSGAHAADDGGSDIHSPLHQLQFSSHRIDGIYNIIIPGKIKLLRRFREIEHLISADNTIRVDIQNASSGCLHFGHPHRGMGGKDLAVNVGNAHRVAVDEIQLPDAAAGQSFHRIAAYAADTKDSNPGLLQPLQGIGSQKHPGSQKLFVYHK